MSKLAIVCIVTFFSTVRSQSWNGANQLQPVHGLFVKPSSDGTTGDLYVAATEDIGTKAQWLTDHPVNFLPTTPQASVPVAYPSYPTLDESTNTQNRAVINPVQYAYAVPVNPSEGNQYQLPAQIPLQYPAVSSPGNQSPCDKASPIPYPYQFFNPQIIQASLQAFANAKNLLKDTGMSDEKVSAVVPQGFGPYSYPTYVMMDISAWTQPQPTQTTTTEPAEESST